MYTIYIMILSRYIHNLRFGLICSGFKSPITYSVPLIKQRYLFRLLYLFLNLKIWHLLHHAMKFWALEKMPRKKRSERHFSRNLGSITRTSQLATM